MSNQKPRVDRGDVDPDVQTNYEPVPHYISDLDESVYHNKFGSFIVMGKDRPRGTTSGYGGAKHTQCAAIDIVVGRMGASPRADAHVDADFKKDAARIYISQKTKVDENFQLQSGYAGSPFPSSAIALKADGIRVIAREGIKLVTGGDSKLSQGGSSQGPGGIDFMAGNNQDQLQPLVKGDNLIVCLKHMLQLINDLTETFNTFVTAQQMYNQALQNHTHQTAGPWGAPVAFPSFESMSANQMCDFWLNLFTTPDITTLKGTYGLFKSRYFQPSGPYYINSENVNTT